MKKLLLFLFLTQSFLVFCQKTNSSNNSSNNQIEQKKEKDNETKSDKKKHIKTNQTVIYDFISKEPSVILPSEHGTSSVFRINNINKFLYEVKIESSQSEFNSTPPAIFSSILNFEKKEETTGKAEAVNVVEKSTTTEANKANVLAFGNEFASFIKNQQVLSAYNEDLEQLTRNPDSLDDSKIEQLNQKISQLTNEIEAQQRSITELNNIIKDEYLKKTTEIYTNGKIVSDAFEQLEESKIIKNKLIRITLTDGLDHKEAVYKISQLTSDYPFIFKPEKLLSSFQKNYNSYKSALQLYLISAAVKDHFKDDETKLKESTIALSSEIEEIKKKADKYDYIKLFEEINQLITELNNENNYFVVSDPIQAKKDIILYNVKITPRKGIETLTAHENRDFDIEVPIYGGVKIDFSTGLFITTNLYDRKYTKTELAADPSQIIITKNKNNSVAQLSLGALMHISPRWVGSFKPGFTFGLGLNSTDISTAQIFIGGSAIFGSSERFIVSTGISFANVDYLSSKYSLDTPIKKTILDQEISITEKSIQAGWFISFTYNLTNKKQQ